MGTGCFPYDLPAPLLTSDSPRRGGQSNLGWMGNRASVTVNPHCRGPFPFPIGGLRLCLPPGEEEESLVGQPGPAPPAPGLSLHPCVACLARAPPRHCWSQTPPQRWAAGWHSFDWVDRAVTFWVAWWKSPHIPPPGEEIAEPERKKERQRVGVLAPGPSSHPCLSVLTPGSLIYFQAPGLAGD